MIHNLFALLLMLLALIGCASPKPQVTQSLTEPAATRVYRDRQAVTASGTPQPACITKGRFQGKTVVAKIDACLKVHPSVATFTQVHHGAFNVVVATVTCPPSFPQVTGGGGAGGGGAISLSEPTTGSDGWTVSGVASNSFPTVAYAICENP